MSQELLYTSAPRGLKPGSRGFCTVLSTQGMPAPLATALEGLSGYRLISSAGDKGANRNPIVYSHLILPAGGRTLNVLSRIAEFGLDYSQRANKLAHHVVLDKTELLPGGPANLLSTPDFMREQWQGEPKVVAFKPVKREGRLPSGPCRAWEERTGDAGWAGVLAESFLRDPERLVFLMFAPGQEILPLFAEALSLLPVERRWNVTFSTYFTGLVPGTTCVWRAMVYDSKEAHESLRFVQALRVDLTSGSLGPARGGTLVEAARSGVRPHDAKPRPAPPIGPAEEESVELEDAQVEFATDEHPAAETHFAGIPQRPPQLAPGRNSLPTTAAPQPRSGRRLVDVIEAESRRPRSRRWLWITSFLTAAAVGIYGVGRWWQQAAEPNDGLTNSHKMPSDNVADATKPANAVASSAAVNDPRSNTSVQKREVMHQPLATNIVPTTTIAPVPTASNEIPNTTAALTPHNQQLKPVTQIPVTAVGETVVHFVSLLEAMEPVPIYSFEWPGQKPPPTFAQLHTLAANRKNERAWNEFKRTFDTTPPTNLILCPSWIKWKIKTPAKVNLEEKSLLQIDVQNNPASFPHASVNLFENGKTFRYILKRTISDEAKFLSWCAVEVRKTDVEAPPLKRVFLNRPIEVTAAQRQFSKQQRSIDWKSTLPIDDGHLPQLSVDELAIQIGKDRYPIATHHLIVGSDERLPIAAVSDLVSREIGITTKKTASFRCKASKETDNLKFTFTLSGLSGKDGLLADIDDLLSEERKILNPQNLDLGEFKVKYGEFIKKLFEERSSDQIGDASETIKRFTEQELPQLKVKAKDKKEELRLLAELEGNLKTLPEKMRSLHQRYWRFVDFKREMDEVRIVSAKISYELFSTTDTEKVEPVKAYVVNFDENPSSNAKNEDPKQ